MKKERLDSFLKTANFMYVHILKKNIYRIFSYWPYPAKKKKYETPNVKYLDSLFETYFSEKIKTKTYYVKNTHFFK